MYLQKQNNNGLSVFNIYIIMITKLQLLDHNILINTQPCNLNTKQLF